MSERTGEEIWAAVGRGAPPPVQVEEPKQPWRYKQGNPRPPKAVAEAAVAETGGNVAAAGRKLGCSNTAMRMSLGIDPSGSSRPGMSLGLTPELVRAAVAAANGNQAEAARSLGCNVSSVRYHLGLDRKPVSGNPSGQHLDLTDEQVAEAYRRAGSYAGAARELGCAKETVRLRLGVAAPQEEGANEDFKSMRDEMHQHRLNQDVPNGTVLVGSDAHIWPGEPTTAMRAFKYMLGELQPRMTILNGDVFDGARISRFPSIGWEHKPDIIGEIGACQEQLREIRALMPEGTRAIWTLGNHDLRFENTIANKAPDLAGVYGVHLKDHFPDWEPCWSIWINPGVAPAVVKHRFKGGIHARHSNTLYAGMTMVTGHLHSLGVTPWSDYHGVRYGVDTGTMAVPYSGQFAHYTEDNPVNWRSGFAVLTFREGRLLWPEVVHVLDEASGLVEFRGEGFHV